MISLLENPQFQSTMNEALQNPQLIDMMIQQNPVLREMGPGVRQMMQSPAFRRMLTDPNAIRQMTQMQRSMGIGPFGAGGGGNVAFPAPGVTNTTPEENRQQQTTNIANNPSNAQNPFNVFGLPGAQGAAGNPFAALFGANPTFGAQPTSPPNTEGLNAPREGTADGVPGGSESPPPNPFALLFNPTLFGQPPTDPSANTQQTAIPPNLFANLQNNPFLQDPALLSQLLQAMGGQNPASTDAANNPFAALFPPLATSPPPQDTRPPEERYAEQLRQLNDMGFYEFERNIEALRRTGGSVQGAVEYLLNNL
jgi:ubiquilin